MRNFLSEFPKKLIEVEGQCKVYTVLWIYEELFILHQLLKAILNTLKVEGKKLSYKFLIRKKIVRSSL